MKCSNCGENNKTDANFCISCGNKITKEENNNVTSEQSKTKITTEENKTNENNVQTTTNENTTNVQNTNNTKKDNKWLKIGLPVVIVIIIICAVFGSNSNENTYSGDYDSSYNKVDARTQFGNYLVNFGFTRNSSTNYTMYKDGYLYTIDFNDAIMSLENSTMYTVYYYKNNISGVASISDNLKIISTYNLNTYEYQCETEPSTYQSYSCSYVKSSFIELAEASKKAFDAMANSAGISVSDL